MKPRLPSYPRILAIALSSRGFGYVVLEGVDTLADWGTQSVKGGDKNAQSVAKVKDLIMHYQPEVLALQDTGTQTSKRATRIKRLTKQLIALATKQKVSVRKYSREQIQKVHFPEGQGTKYELAQVTARRFPEELGPRLPHKRRPWESDPAVMDMFEATALARMPLLWKKVRP